MFMPPGTLALLLVAVLASVGGMIVVRRFIPAHKLSENNEYVGFTFSILSLVYGIYLAFTVVVVWQQLDDADEKVAREVALVNTLWRNAEPFPAADRMRLRRHLIAYLHDVIENDFPKMEHGLETTMNEKNDVIWDDYYQLSPDPNDIRQVSFYREGLDRLNDFAMARRLRILASNNSLPTSMWVLLIAGAVGTIMFTWFYGTRYLSIQIAATAFLSAVIVYGVLLVSMLEYPFGNGLRVTPAAYEELLHTFETRINDVPPPAR
ncbi:MAG: DUF4239 domain-containing protein [Acidobacteria bacterium]|nr:DUF4239 domain-containing protein [Acidobacteriota bacterium]MBV9478530.1 DUF4239 domain-containing protein [Acidobacteriota bacterium]